MTYLPKFIVLLFAVVICSGSVNSGEEPRYNPEYLGTTPLPMLNDMRNNNCQPIRNFYDSFITMWPPYVLINNFKNYAFLCELVSKEGLTEGFKLIVKSTKKNSPFYDCSQTLNLEYVKNYNKPAGITFEKKIISNDNGNDYVKEILTVATDDGGFTEFYCENKKWIDKSYE